MSIFASLYSERGKRLSDMGALIRNDSAAHTMLAPMVNVEAPQVSGPPPYVLIGVDAPWQGQTATEHGGGILLANRRAVLTAAHVVLGRVDRGRFLAPFTRIECAIGAGSRDRKPLVMASNTIIVHAEYEAGDAGYRNDLALIILPEAAPAENAMRIHSIRAHEIEEGERITAWGMGVHESGPEKGTLRRVIRSVDMEATQSSAGILHCKPITGFVSKADSGGPGWDSDEEEAYAGVISHYFDGDEYRTSSLIPATKALPWAMEAYARYQAQSMNGQGFIA